MFRVILVVAGVILFGAIGAGPASPDTAGGTLIGTVGSSTTPNQFTISLTLNGSSVEGSTLPPGDYTLTVTDYATIHDFHIFGPGLDQVVSTVPQTGTVTTTIHLTHGTYTFQCDPHKTIMIGMFTVSDRPPVANDDSASTTSGGSTTIPVLANDTDADGDSLTPSLVTPPAHGTATVNADGTITYAAPSSFAGTDTFTYSDSDGIASSAPATVTVSVQDATPPTLAPHADVTGVDATGPGGATVAYTNPTATDNIDPNPSVSCAPPSGSTFAIGTTTVGCTATDASGNSSQESFAVQVEGAGDQLDDLAAAVTGVGVGNSLAAIVAAAQHLNAAGAPFATCITLDVFQLDVRIQQLLRKLPGAQADSLVGAAQRIKAVLGC
jgi:Bacterial Ig domain/HYR domain